MDEGGAGDGVSEVQVEVDDGEWKAIFFYYYRKIEGRKVSLLM